jgi:hypothetical protein
MPTPHPTVPDRLLQHARKLAMPCCSPEGLACAAVPIATFAHDLQPVRSRAFQEWLARTFFGEHEVVPSRYALRAATSMLEALASDPAAPRRSTQLRVSSTGNPLHPESILLDLANPQGDAVEITAAGWTVTEPHGPFRRSRTAQPLPAPVHHAAAPSRIALPGFALHPACLAWLLAALRPTGPYPILILQGPAAAGKTMLARMLRTLIDPASSSVCRHPRSPRDLLRLAWNNYVLVFDHVTRFPGDIADSLCRLSSGAGFAFDEFPDGSDALVSLQRPILVTAPSAASGHFHQLRNRAIVVDLPAIAPQARRTEADLLDEFFHSHPAILGRLCTALSAAISNTASVILQNKPTFADATIWAVAAAPSLGIPADEMLASLTPDTFAGELAAFVHETGPWEGTPTELHAILQARGVAGLPASPTLMSRKIHDSAFGAYGVHVEQSRTRAGRRIRVTLTTRSTVTATLSA